MFRSSKRFSCTASVVSSLALTAAAHAGIYSAGSNDPTNAYDAPVSSTSPLIQHWADTVVEYVPSPGVSASFQNPTTGFASLGDLDASQIANGDAPGYITLSFSQPITNGSGKDFAVFENAFTFGGGVFMELAYVEVSTDGSNFARFDSLSLNTAPVAGSGAFASFDPTNVYNLAGKHLDGWGTPFDLDELTSHALVIAGLLDLNEINYVRLVDIPGSGDFTDSQGNGIIDNWVTTGSGGFDFRLSQGIAVLPEPCSLALVALGSTLLIRRSRRQRSLA